MTALPVDHWCPLCPHGAEHHAQAAAAERARAQVHRRRQQLQQFAGEHRQQLGRHRHDFAGYDRHLRLSCPVCDTAAGFTTVVDPAEARRMWELMNR